MQIPFLVFMIFPILYQFLDLIGNLSYFMELDPNICAERLKWYVHIFLAVHWLKMVLVCKISEAHPYSKARTLNPV